MADEKIQIIETPIEDEMRRSYIDYAMSVIVSRALPDVRDGLKPVQRRIIYAMSDLVVWNRSPHKKCARLVGETMGKYHPHGESAIYDALVRMAQPFTMRYPLVDGHGNFGSIDGDSAAAMRYTEARFTLMAEQLLVDIGKDTIDWTSNFDESLKEPTVLPSRVPNLLINGSAGIAVGMATNIPPHNLGEVVDALTALADDPDLTSLNLMEYVHGPDFPTGGLIIGSKPLQSLYTTGRGVLTVRAKTRIETKKNGKQTIIIEELPYQVQKSRLIESIAALVREKKIQGITDLRDESDKREGLRIAIEVRKDVQPEVVRNQLFKHTSLQVSFGGIMLALVNNKPEVLDLRGMLWNYLLHRKDVIIRRTQYDLNKALERAHILAGIIVALDNLDEVIALIRASGSPEEAREGLMERFGLDEIQARAILDMKLERLTRMERDRIVEERAALLKEIEYFRAVLGSERMVMNIIKKDLEDVRKQFADDRRTRILEKSDDISDEELIIEQDVTVILTRMGYIKRMPLAVHRSQRRGGTGATAMQTRDEDWVEKVVTTTTRDSLLLFTTKGKAYWLRVYDIPEASKQAKGYPVSRLVQLEDDEMVTALIEARSDSGEDLLFITKRGICKRTPISEYGTYRRVGLRALNIREGDSLVLARTITDDDQILMASASGKGIRIRASDIRPMGRVAAGVRGMRLAKGDHIVGADVTGPGGLALFVSELGFGKITSVDEFPLHRRGGSGVICMGLTEKTGPLAIMRVVEKNGQMLLLTAGGVALRTQLSQVRVYKRPAMGVTLIKVDPPDRVAACSIFDGDMLDE